MKQIMFFNTILNAFIFHGVFSHSILPKNVAHRLRNEAYDRTSDEINGLREVIGDPVDAKEVRFYLHTFEDSEYSNRTIDPLHPNEVARKDSKIYILIHGFTQTRETTPWFQPLTKFLVEQDSGANVVQTDWSKPAAEQYPFAAFSTESVGNIIGNFINKLVHEYEVPLKNIVVVGHSLGAQVAGWIGKRYYELNHEKLPRIIGLDPAGPLFSKRPDDRRLNQNDAEVVMVVHTNGGLFGIASPCGTIDFFPNGGRVQPGCSREDSGKELNMDDPQLWCDHRRAYDLFVEAVKYPNMFLAQKCRNYDDYKKRKCEHIQVALGDIKTTERGLFYLNTGGKPPFF